ncbi:MAG TPA: hypothetical protein VL983_04210 [Terriglobales bacterium]|nr:hypothetical protein [Terriglobales bacterium]
MADPIRISLRYIGPEVNTGEMDIDEVSSALAGFSRAYSKTASEISPESTHRLKVAALQESSFDVFIVAAMQLTKFGDVVQQIETVTNAARFAFELITEVIRVKQHLKGKNYTYNLNGRDNKITVINIDHLEMDCSKAAFGLIAEKVIDNDIDRIVAPLRDNAITAAELKEVGNDKGAVVIESTQREYFRPDHSLNGSVKDSEVTGRFISLNKERNSGRFELKNGERVPYHYIGNDPLGFHRDFSRKGMVRALVDAVVDDSLTPVSLNIKAIRNVQTSFDLLPSDSTGKV